MRLQSLFAFIVFILALGCNSNPYAGIDKKLSPNPVKDTNLDPPFVIDAPQKVDVYEGVQATIKVTGQVQDGSPILSFENLPAGAVFDSTSSQLVWTPPVGAAVDPSDKSSGVRLYSVTVTLSSNSPQDASTKKQGVIILVCHAQAQPLQVSGLDSGATIYEGQTYQATISVMSQEFPTGPFVVSSADLPRNVQIQSVPSDPTKFTISYTPPYDTVTLSNHQNYCPTGTVAWPGVMCNVLNWKLIFYDSRNNAGTVNVAWTVMDVRQDPLVLVPTSVVANQNSADAYVLVEDPNGERIPTVTMSANNPTNGSGTISIDGSDNRPASGNPYATVHVNWTADSTQKPGTTQNVSIDICVPKDYSANRCVTKSFTVQYPAAPPSPTPPGTNPPKPTPPSPTPPSPPSDPDAVSKVKKHPIEAN